MIAPFWGFSILALPLMFFADVCNLLLPIIALSVLVLSLRAFFVKEFARFNKIVGGLTLIMIITLIYQKNIDTCLSIMYTKIGKTSE
mgnify:CR=1 FL=1